ncbi:SAM-dependent methyltransferase [Paenibacillus sp. IB182496]|uniref:SAM-dependent methyltransferase n=1 Tax=Paenibacillus sabuli TaxID=2772509 RepID=A0A927BW59_9BACL|nr:SAM-dependent methyltransferase [Paenibacillus sabuli]MBD2847962.1 SAM-dependent methyltransferase [Paenibacillus sabuli]
MSIWIGTANKGYASYAMEELRRTLGAISCRQLEPGETFLFEAQGERDTVWETILANEPIFLRHVQPVDRELPLSGDADDLEELTGLIRHARHVFEGRGIAVHLRKMQASPFPYSAADTKALLDAVLTELGGRHALQDPELILSLYATTDRLLVGWGSPEGMLSDWPGGAVRFQREDGQISRAKFKLLEAERSFDLSLQQFEQALDVGAAPGGWTSLLLERGLRVTAIDPAELHPSLHGHPGLTVLRQNASEAKLQPYAFDLLVCDMSWSPTLMCKLVLDLREALRSGAHAIVTVKLMHRKPLQTIRDVIGRLEQGFELRKAKQLFHNRDEITLHLCKRG